MCWCPLTILSLIGLVEAMASGPSHYGELGIKHCAHSSIILSLSL